MPSIRLISTSIVSPTRHSDEPMDRIELTPWDFPILQGNYIQKGLLFHKPADQLVNQNLIQHLKASFSCTLNMFHPLAGRLSLVENQYSTPCLHLNCNGLGAHFVHAAAEGVTVADVLDPDHIPDHIIDSFFCMNSVRNYEGISRPLLAVQVTELVDGVFIGCSMNHGVADGTSFWHFFNTWSEFSRSRSDDDQLVSHISTNACPVFSRRFLDGLIDLPVHIPFSQIQYLERLTHQTPSNSSSFVQKAFHFPKEKVAHLKAKANAEMGTNVISSLQALMAHLWRATTRARYDLKSDEETIYRVAVGIRQRLEPPFPDHYMGNALLVVQVKSTVSDLLQNGGLGCTALKINKAIGDVTHEYVTQKLEEWMRAPTLVPTFRVPLNVHTLITGSSQRFNVYGNDFGWGRPLAVRSGPASKKVGTLTVYPGAAEEGSVEFQVCLSPETIRAMVNDAEFMEAVVLSRRS